MPTIPRYQSVATPSELPSVRVPSSAPQGAFGGGPGSAQVTAASQKVMGIAQDLVSEEKKKADDSWSIDAYSKLANFKNDSLFNPQSGAMNKKGKDAFGVTKEYGDKFTEFADRLAETATNDDQRIMLHKMRQRIGSELHSSLEKHTFSESQKYKLGVFKSAVESSRNDAVLNYSEPDKIQKSLALQGSLISQYVHDQGLPDDVAKEQIAEAQSKTHSDVIMRMLVNGQTIPAKQYYDQVKGGLLGDDADKVGRALKAGVLRAQSQASMDQIVGEHDTLGSALEAARKIKDPDQREATVSLVRGYFSDKHQAEAESDKSRFDAAADIVEKSHDVHQIPPNVWSELTLNQRHALEVRQKQLRAGIEPEPNGDDYYNLMQMAATPSLRDKFLQTNLTEYRHKMTDNELHKLISIQAASRKGSKDADNILDGYRSDSQIVNDALREMDINPSPKPGSNDSKQVNQFRRAVDEQIARFGQVHGKKPTNEQVQQIVDALSIEGATHPDRWFFHGKKRLFELTPEDQHFEIQSDEIPEGERQKIERALRSHGIVPTEAKISQLYGMKLRGMVNRGS